MVKWLRKTLDPDLWLPRACGHAPSTGVSMCTHGRGRKCPGVFIEPWQRLQHGPQGPGAARSATQGFAPAALSGMLPRDPSSPGPLSRMGIWVSDMLTGACCLLTVVGMGRGQGEGCCTSSWPSLLSPLLCGWWRDSVLSVASRQQLLGTQHPVIASCSPCPCRAAVGPEHFCWQLSMYCTSVGSYVL